MGPTKEYPPPDPNHAFWKAQPTDAPPADSEHHTPLDPRGIFWRLNKPRNDIPVELELAVRHYAEPIAITPMPKSPELIAYERQLQIDAVYDEAATMNVAHDVAIHAEANAMNSQLEHDYSPRHKMGKLAAMSLNMLAFKEVVGIKTRLVGKAMGRLASKLSGYQGRHAATKPAGAQMPEVEMTGIQSDSMFTAEDRAFLQGYGRYRREIDPHYDGMQLANVG